MSYQIISSDYFSSNWYQYLNSPVETDKTKSQEYTLLGSFSQETNWEKVFALGDEINSELQMTEQEFIDELSSIRKRKNK